MEDSILRIIADNPILSETLLKLFEKRFQSPQELESLSTDTSDQVIGQITRANLTGLGVVRTVFKEIECYRTAKAVPDGTNPAR